MLNIKLSEDILNSNLWPENRKNSEFTKFEAYIYILISLSLSKNSIFEISILGLSKKLNWSRSKVRNFLDTLVKEENFEIFKDSNKTYIKYTEKNSRKNTVEYTKKNSKKDTQKDIVRTDDLEGYKDSKYTYKNMAKDTSKDTEKNTYKDNEKDIEKDIETDTNNQSNKVDVESVIDIIKM
ncbi:MAG: hypothetical protein FH753_12705 [Firmicutes bacterium]|nr:hypothetical protein [Bacillota bacterium]